MNLSHWRTKRAPLFWKAIGMANQGWLLVLTGKASDAVQNDHRRDHRMAVNRGNKLVTVVLGIFGAERMQNSANSMMLGAASVKR